MIMKIKFLLLSVAAIFALASCDRVNAPYEQNPDDTNNTVEVPRKVLLTEFTGMYCTFCPLAADLAKQLKEELYKDKLIILSVHASDLAEPRPPHNLDFRTSEGTEIFTYFSGQTLPAGLIDRTGTTLQTKLLTAPDWDARIKDQLKKSAPLTIKLDAAYDEAEREITADVELEYFNGTSTRDQLSVFIIEDGIIAYQKDNRLDPPDIEDYEHNHMLRASFNGAWGEQVSAAAAPKKGDKVSKQLKFKIPEGKNWNVNKLKVIAFVHDFGGTYEIMQAEEAEVAAGE